MPAQIQSLPRVSGPAFVREARVLQALPEDFYRVRVQGPEPLELTARSALPVAPALQAGDRVLVAGESPATGFIIGVLQSAPEAAIRLPDGAGARILGENGAAPTIAVHDAEGRVVFEYQPHQRRSILHAPTGDLCLAAPGGRIELAAARGIRCATDGEFCLHGERGVLLAAPGADGGPDQALGIDGRGARLEVRRLAVTAGEGEIRVRRADFHGQRLHSTVESAKLVYGKLEVTAQRLWERSGQAIRQVLALCQVQAGRMRTLVTGSHHLHSGRTTIVGREEVRIDGEKINLG
jgi:hypothetical protein